LVLLLLLLTLLRLLLVAMAGILQARTCMELIRAFYTDPESYQTVYQFNHDQSKFSFEQLLHTLGLADTAGAAAAGPS
jgi:hypothetical protein